MKCKDCKAYSEYGMYSFCETNQFNVFPEDNTCINFESRWEEYND